VWNISSQLYVSCLVRALLFVLRVHDLSVFTATLLICCHCHLKLHADSVNMLLYAGNRLLGSCAVCFWLEPTFRRNISPPSSGQVNSNENIVSRCLHAFLSLPQIHEYRCYHIIYSPFCFTCLLNNTLHNLFAM
jgi:hypothetical protein